MTLFTKRHCRCSESGIAMLIAIFTLLLVTAIGVGMVLLTNTDISTSSNFRDEQIAFFAAKGGMEEVRDRFRTGATNSLSANLPTALMGSANGVLYVLNPTGNEPDTPWNTTGNAYPDDEICGEVTNMGLACGVNPAAPYTTANASSAYQPASGSRLSWKWTRVNLKTNLTSSGSSSTSTVDGNSTDKNELVCWTGANEVTTILATCQAANYQPIYVLTTLAVTTSGSRRMIQSEATPATLNLIIPGALTVDGPSLAASTICASGSTCNSGGAYLSGDEPASGSPSGSCSTGGIVPAIATADATSASNFTTGVNSNKSNIVGSGGPPSVGNAATALANLSTVSQVEALVTQLTNLAGSNTCTTSCGSLNLGTAANPTVTVVNNANGSAFQLNSGTTGYGILVVTGTLDYVNVNSYQGVVLMLGTAQFVSSSSKDTVLTGALFMAQDRDPTTGALLAGPGLGTTPVFNFHHGSASATDPSIQYNACVINQVEAAATTNYKIVAVRELMK
jgi:Tfp pilus assembly protein PilX